MMDLQEEKTEMDQLREKMNVLIHNRSNIPLIELKTRYMYPYTKLKTDIAYLAKKVLLQELKDICYFFDREGKRQQEVTKQISFAMDNGCIGKRISESLFKHMKLEEYLSILNEAKDLVWTICEKAYMQQSL